MSEKFSFENFINHLPAILLSAVHENSCNFMLLPLLLAVYFCASISKQQTIKHVALAIHLNL